MSFSLALDSLSKTHQEDLKKSVEKKEAEWTKDKENILRQLQDTEKVMHFYLRANLLFKKLLHKTN